MKYLQTPLQKKELSLLRAGNRVSFDGVIFTARDQAHKRLVALMREGRRLPIELKNQIVYYCGPTATPPGQVIGSCGPTTSMRMDQFVGPLLTKGVAAMIGKGRRSKGTREEIAKKRALYFIAPSGCGALLSQHVRSSKLIAFSDLGAEGIYRLEVADFPLIVAIDSLGKSIYLDPSV